MERIAHIGSQIDVDWGGVHRISPANFEGVDRNIAHPTGGLPVNSEQAIAVSRLLHRGWFDRLWIRQEIFVAEDRGVVCCGPQQMPWLVFRKALRLFYSKRPEPGNMISLLEDRLHTIGGLVFQLRWTDILLMRGSFEKALCSDPRDYVYGIRALLLPDQQDLCGAPDYSRSTVQVFSDLARGYIQKYPNGLTIVRQCELPAGLSSWPGPSWVPDWSSTKPVSNGDTTASPRPRSEAGSRSPKLTSCRFSGCRQQLCRRHEQYPSFTRATGVWGLPSSKVLLRLRAKRRAIHREDPSFGLWPGVWCLAPWPILRTSETAISRPAKRPRGYC